jgi:hypothetical protein
MGRWFKQFEALIWAASLIVASMAYVYASFATKDYVDNKHESVMEILHRIDVSVQKIDDRTYNLAREK